MPYTCLKVSGKYIRSDVRLLDTIYCDGYIFFVPVSGLALSDVACIPCDNLLIDRTIVAIRCNFRIGRKRIPRHDVIFILYSYLFPGRGRGGHKHSFPDEPVSWCVSLSILTIPMRACNAKIGMICATAILGWNPFLIVTISGDATVLYCTVHCDGRVRTRMVNSR
jgi:hypothetical protein